MADQLFDEMVKRAVGNYVQDNPQQPPAPEPQKKSSSTFAHAAWLAPAAADIATTLYAQHHPELKLDEANPLTKWAPKNAQVPIGAGMEGLAYYLGRRFLKDKHPKIFNAALIGAGALHGKAALSNVSNIMESKQYLKDNGLDKLKFKDGYYYDPSAFIN